MFFVFHDLFRKAKDVDLEELDKNLEDARSQLNSLNIDNLKCDLNQIHNEFNFKTVSQTLDEVNEEITSSVTTVKKMEGLCLENQQPIEIDAESLKATYNLLKTTEIIIKSFSNLFSS